MRTRPRTQAERDAATVEIIYALASAAFLAAVMFGAIAGPLLVWDFPRPLDQALLLTATVVSTALALTRVVHVLRS